jgi:hypothetical protein
MKVERTGSLSLSVDFDSEEELRAEQQANMKAGGLFLRTEEELAPFAIVTVRLRLPGRGETTVKASVVGTLPGALALQLQDRSADIVPSLLASAPSLNAAEPEKGDDDDEGAATDAGSLWDRVRAMTPPQKMMLAPKADRATRALLMQGKEPMLLFALLKNPRLGIEEVVRLAKSSALGFQAAELILKTVPWNKDVDVLVAMVHNPKLPLPLGLRIVASLPDSELRVIAKGAATSAALKQAALRRVTAG